MADTNALFSELKSLSKDDAKQLEEKLRAKMPKGKKKADAASESAADSGNDDSAAAEDAEAESADAESES